MDLRALCAALGFTTVVMQGGRVPKQEAARRASDVAGLIEEFCRIAVPKAFEHAEEEVMQVVDLVTTRPEGKFGPAERMATAIVEIYREQGGCLPQDLLAQGLFERRNRSALGDGERTRKDELNIMDS
jgi:hypothetical protein